MKKTNTVSPHLLAAQKGFTIIEVLIVLAIAGLILLIVFLAVPALQRNSRNTQRKANVSAILGAVQEFTNNNNGSLPAAACNSSNPYKFVLGTCGAPTGTGADFNQGYYTAAPTVAAGAQSALATDVAVLVTGAKCGTSGATLVGSNRQIAVQYMIEGTGGLIPACQDS